MKTVDTKVILPLILVDDEIKEQTCASVQVRVPTYAWDRVHLVGELVRNQLYEDME